MHLRCCPLGKGDGEQLLTRHAALADEIGDALGQGTCFARPRTGDHDNRPCLRLYRLPLRLVERPRDRVYAWLHRRRDSRWPTCGRCDVWHGTCVRHRQGKKGMLPLELLTFGATKDVDGAVLTVIARQDLYGSCTHAAERFRH